MSNNKTTDSFQKSDNETISINQEEEKELLINYTNKIKNEETRSEAIDFLYKYREKNDNLALYLWFTRGTMAALLQEIIKIYQDLSPSKLTKEKSDKILHIISLLQSIALHPKTRKEFLDSQILVFLYPFLSCTNKTKTYEFIRMSALMVIAAMVKIDDSDVINFLVNTGLIPNLLKILEKGGELTQSVTCFILQRIVFDINGLRYICDMKQRLHAITYILRMALQNNTSKRLNNYILKIYLGLISNKDAKNIIKQELPENIRDENFISNLNDSSKNKVKILLKSLDEDESGNDMKIKKLKNDLTNKKNNSIPNINIVNNNNNLNNFTNGNNQMNLNNNEINNNMNLNMMLINNMNPMKMQPGYMISPHPGDFNYNIYNDNENYMNTNIYNQNSSNGFGNLNFYNNYKNV